MSSKKFLMIAFLIVVIMIVAVNWNQVKAATNKVIKPSVKSPDASPAPAPATVTKLISSSVLKRGVSGSDVSELQKRLNKLIAADSNAIPALTVDGQFGAKTEAALLRYTGNSQITVGDSLLL